MDIPGDLNYALHYAADACARKTGGLSPWRESSLTCNAGPGGLSRGAVMLLHVKVTVSPLYLRPRTILAEILIGAGLETPWATGTET